MQKDKICIELTFNKVLSYSKKKSERFLEIYRRNKAF